MISEWFDGLLWVNFDLDTPLRQIGWVYVALIVLIYKLITLIKRM